MTMNHFYRWTIAAVLGWAFSLATTAAAHFGCLLPSADILGQGDGRNLKIEAKFIHPMERHYLEMAKPAQFGVLHHGEKQNLLETLQEAKGKGPDQTINYTFWQTDYTIKRPGDYTFYLEPVPYWEPAEDKFIIHYTKVCVNAFGLEQGWDTPVGMETEIVPLARPYGLWTGNLFTGQVLLNGQPVPHAEIEIEYLNEPPGNISVIVPPSGPYVTQVVKADASGIFSYAMPRAGWWGFAALHKAARTLKHDGQDKGIEIGAVFWVRTIDMR